MDSYTDSSKSTATLRALAVLEKSTTAYCLVKSRPVENYSYQQMLTARENHTKLSMGTPSTIVIIPPSMIPADDDDEMEELDMHASLTEYAVRELRQVLQDEAEPIDESATSNRSRIWHLPTDGLVVLSALSRIGFETSQCHIDADGVHTWTLRCCAPHATTACSSEAKQSSEVNKIITKSSNKQTAASSQTRNPAPNGRTNQFQPIPTNKRKTPIAGNSMQNQQATGDDAVNMLFNRRNDVVKDTHLFSADSEDGTAADDDENEFKKNSVKAHEQQQLLMPIRKGRRSVPSLKKRRTNDEEGSDKPKILPPDADIDDYIGRTRNNVVPSSSASTSKDPLKRFCDMCDKHFRSNYDYRRHMHAHTGERPFSCLVCGHGSNQRNQVTIHIKKYHMQQQK